MKTKVAISMSNDGNYRHLTMKILRPRFPHIEGDLTSIGTITWQGDKKYGYYAMRFHVEAEPHNAHHLLAMYKLACYLKERTIDCTPQEAMAIIGGIEHFYLSGMYVSIEDNNKFIYDVNKLNNDKDALAYTRIVAANDTIAQRIVNGMQIKRILNADVAYSFKAHPERLQLSLTNLTYKN